jgi:hypothetical protein
MKVLKFELKMKYLLSTLALFCSISLFAQHETLLNDIDVIGGFGGPILEISEINGQIGADVGGGGALLLNGFFLGGYGMGTDFPTHSISNGENRGDYDISFRHGGLWLGYTSQPFKVAHLFFSTKLGWGRAELEQDDETVFRDRMFAVTPELGIEFNITQWFRIAATGGYRWVNGIEDIPTLGNEDFSSPTGTITFSFGGFAEENDWDDWDDDNW